MTAQISDTMLYKRRKYNLACEPLEVYLETIKERPIFNNCLHTACWRGYVAQWKVKYKKLYLIGFEGDDCDTLDWPEGVERTCEMDKLFPNQKEVFADWFSGEVEMNRGTMLYYVHAGYESEYEQKLSLYFENGILVDVMDWNK